MSLSPPPERSAPPVISLLYIAGDETHAKTVLGYLDQTMPGLAVTRCPSLAAARRHFGADAYDVVLVDHDLPDGTGFDVLQEVALACVTAPVIVETDARGQAVETHLRAAGAFDLHPRAAADQLAERLRRALLGVQLRGDGEVAPMPTLAVSPPPASEDAEDLLRRLLERVSETTHAINNPLTVISGNAQLLAELSRFAEVDPLFLKPIADIEEASVRLADTLQGLSRLKAQLQEQVRLMGHA